jgi:cohesin complex subunit SA-1/2
MDGLGSLVESARNRVDPAWRLSEVEEIVLLEVLNWRRQPEKKYLLHVIICSDGTEVVFFSQGDEETVVSDLTRALIKGLPRLFIKYQTDETRISDVLFIPPLPVMNLDLYLEMRMTNVRRREISVDVDE